MAGKTKGKHDFRVKRVYDEPGDDGCRVLVDRLWPRGVSKDRARIDEWPKDVTPSDELRTWFHHDGGSFAEFRKRYRAELGGKAQQEALRRLRELGDHGPVTLVTAAKDPDHSQVAVILEALR
jgi:uncharacterized protein YeaO (DUF488 family)